MRTLNETFHYVIDSDINSQVSRPFPDARKRIPKISPASGKSFFLKVMVRRQRYAIGCNIRWLVVTLYQSSAV
ncbi:hypothetical protein LZ31DRAFT_165000 [Colletotrichum somersetense]|nr:hypothetical protein LZ31DRAFT_165000 [Colletotrichum somersetense]